MTISSIASTLKAYSIPLILFTAAIVFQLSVIPRSFPPSHYDVLGIKRYSSIEEVTLAYEKLSSKWNSGIEVPSTFDFVKIRYAFELLSNQAWKRDYDIFGIDERIHVIEEVKEQYAAANIYEIDLPLLEAASFDPIDHDFDLIKSENFLSKFENDKALLVQVFSLGSSRCAKFYHYWKRIVNLLDGVANAGMVELDDVHLAAHLVEKKSTGQPFFRNGLPSLVAFPPGCKSSACVVRYAGELSVDAVADWFATTILSLPRITYYSKESMAQNFLVKSARHKVRVIFISRTGERATPFVRQAAKDYWAYASFAFALWREQEASFWWNMFGVESAPAIVFLRDPGIKPVIYHGSVNNSWFLNIMEKNKHQVLPQLRSVTSMELGCDARGHSQAGNDTMIWYCAVLAGRQSLELDKMRETMRRLQESLSRDGVLNVVDQDTASTPAAVALKEKRLMFTWLDGEAQKKYCFFYINSEDGYETCGPRRDITDVPKLFIVRYKKKATEDGMQIEKKPKNLFEALHSDDSDPASQLVAVYNGSAQISEIIQWISQIIRDGDSRDLPFFRATTPALVPEDGDPIWSQGTEKLISTSKGVKQKIGDLIRGIYDYLYDPRIGPILLLGALMSFGSIWLRRSQSTLPIESSHSCQPSTTDDGRPSRRKRHRTGSNQDPPPSITDVEPKDAHQMKLSDSDSE